MDSECASGCTWSTARATAPSPGQPTPGVVKQHKSSRGSVDTTKTRSGQQRVRMSSGERPIGAAKGKQSDTEALCQTPPQRSKRGRGRCPINSMLPPVQSASPFRRPGNNWATALECASLNRFGAGMHDGKSQRHVTSRHATHSIRPPHGHETMRWLSVHHPGAPEKSVGAPPPPFFSFIVQDAQSSSPAGG